MRLTHGRGFAAMAILAAFGLAAAAPLTGIPVPPRHSAFRKGRRSRITNMDGRFSGRAGAKLAKKAAKGALTINGIR